MSTLRHEYEVTLPIGHTDAAGAVHRRAVLRKMTGAEEALLYDSGLNAAEVVSRLVVACLVRLGDDEAVEPCTVTDLHSADRDYLLLELRRVTLGDRLRASYGCPACGAAVDVEENLAKLPVRRRGEDEPMESIEVALEDGWTDRTGDLHRDVALRLPRGEDEEVVARTAERDPMRAREALLLRCIERFGNLPRAELEAYGMKMLRELTLGDRARLFSAIDDAPGVDFRRAVRCDACGTRSEALLDATAFFEPG